MCGILVAAEYAGKPVVSDWLYSACKDRGPDAFNQITAHYGACTVFAAGSVLSLRDPLVQQPLQFADGSWLLFNGELYQPDNVLHPHINDTLYLSERIVADGLLPALNAVTGEYAVVYYSAVDEALFFLRDRIGMRSLVYSLNEHSFVVASAGLAEPVEVAPYLLYKFDFATFTLSTASIFERPVLSKHIALSDIATAVQRMRNVLTTAVRRRVARIPDQPLAVLFSGGLDCTILARIVDLCLPPGHPIDLVNVAFDHPRTDKTADDAPDRHLGLQSWRALAQLSDRPIRFVAVNVPFSLVETHRQRVANLMKPLDSVMDLSIALAFYFAARADGATLLESGDSEQHTTEYRCTSKVFISGLGADELFAGYKRHRSIFQRRSTSIEQSYGALAEELELDFNRLHARNLGRDDRVTGSWARELRYPYLDRDVVEYTLSLSLQAKFNYETDEDKFLLRELARSFSLRFVADTPKRAIQFGARSAKMEKGQGKIKGTDALE
ncbi:hypothetical protein CANCADRAFT_3385 [Tortispora caseinolytica NRRL Y-17796]|uniref:Glutamine amidotransferase type-2 domain-containing protein n=1 Tax=Tortispora caseinolytica NRRL Y-17796 TaxID=767744 RepID=A0A1E4TAG3_9ASCO|nr:hypothetical protein CANCADRAFT_3385 [Tortispora caseinolytica NRRL Y-17796]